MTTIVELNKTSLDEDEEFEFEARILNMVGWLRLNMALPEKCNGSFDDSDIERRGGS